ncbi:hypothetical protein [Methylobacterium trifolii]|uniref:hypothetical protein n=1 Tax=Methylobacterium trifolii TaxID=1003092 RepID=UPI001EE0D506|nr:hypothetical protein [Methylobacterium trifolii]
MRSVYTLARIAEMLEVPVSTFHGPGVDRGSTERLAQTVETVLLALVQDHLRRSDPEGRARFVEAVQAMVAAAAG